MLSYQYELSVITNGFFILHASSEKMCVTLLFCTLQSYQCTSKNTSWCLACHWHYTQFHCMHFCFQDKPDGSVVSLWHTHYGASVKLDFPYTKRVTASDFLSTSNYTKKLHMKVSYKAKSQNPILALKKILNGGWFWPSFSLLSNQQHGRTHVVNLY